MSTQRKSKVRRTKEEKLKIISEAKREGVTKACEKYGIFPSTYYTWVKKLDSMGEAGLQHGMTKEHLKEIKRLQKENDRLRKLVVEQQLESSMKDELLKKKYQDRRPKSL
jgi:putative transposase